MWSDAEVSALIAVWGEADIQEQLDGATRNHLLVSQKCSRRVDMTEIGNNAVPKLRISRQSIKKVKDHNGVTGNGRKTFKFYKKLDEILGHCPASTPPVLLDAGSSSLNRTEADTEESDFEDRDMHSEENEICWQYT